MEPSSPRTARVRVVGPYRVYFKKDRRKRRAYFRRRRLARLSGRGSEIREGCDHLVLARYFSSIPRLSSTLAIQFRSVSGAIGALAAIAFVRRRMPPYPCENAWRRTHWQ